LQLSVKNGKRKIGKRENYGDGKEKQTLLANLTLVKVEYNNCGEFVANT